MNAPAAITRRRALASGAAAGLALVFPGDSLAADRARSGRLSIPVSAWTRGGGRQTAILRGGRFDLVGVRGRGLGAAGLELRARRRGGAWSAWMRLGLGEEHAPDKPRVPGGSDPVWTGGSDELQLRARGARPGRLEATLVTVPTALRSPAAHLARLRAAAAPRQAASTSGPPTIIPRAAWGADQAPPRAAPSYGDVQMAFVHNTVTANDYSAQDSAGIVLAIAKYHEDSNGWNDIGYNLLVDQFGQIFEGRAGGIDKAVIGAQAQGWNSHSTGIAAIGTFASVAFPPAGEAALVRLLAYKLALHGVPAQGTVDLVSAGGADNRYASGRSVTFQRISGHRDGCSTDCPGDALYGQLPDIRAKVAGVPAAAAPKLTIAPAATTVSYGDPATFSGSLLDGGGQPLVGVPVTLAKLGASGKAYVPLLKAATAGDGSWTITLPWKRSAAVRAQAVVPGLAQAVHSTPTSVALLPIVDLSRAPARVLAGQSVALAGTVRPGQPVSVKVERQLPTGPYVLVGYVPLHVRGTAFSGAVRLSKAALYRLTVRTRTPNPVGAPAISVRAVHSASSVGTADAPLAPTA